MFWVNLLPASTTWAPSAARRDREDRALALHSVAGLAYRRDRLIFGPMLRQIDFELADGRRQHVPWTLGEQAAIEHARDVLWRGDAAAATVKDKKGRVIWSGTKDS